MKLIRSSLVLKVAILVVVVYATVMLVSLQKQTVEMNQTAEVLDMELTAMEQANDQLAEAIDEVDTDASVADIARDKLGLVSPGEIVFYDVGN